MKKIGPFEFDTSPSTMKYGYYLKCDFDVPFSRKKRTVRVWLPEDYDFNNPNKRFSVAYFSDGQNLVNKNLTKFGCWDLDKVCHNLLNNSDISFIGVGIDSPADDLERNNELTPPILPDREANTTNPRANLFIDFICNTLKPIIDECFYTLKDRETTAIAGSSMGGLMAFYGGVERSDVFGFALCFSPAFLVYYQKHWKEILKEIDDKINKKTKFYFYVGGVEFEKWFVSLTLATYKYLKKLGFNDREIRYINDPSMPHHEIAWNKYLGDAIEFWLKN